MRIGSAWPSRCSIPTRTSTGRLRCSGGRRARSRVPVVPGFQQFQKFRSVGFRVRTQYLPYCDRRPTMRGSSSVMDPQFQELASEIADAVEKRLSGAFEERIKTHIDQFEQRAELRMKMHFESLDSKVTL